ncbi:hypothetical protein BJF93_07195 [Xaviernesmea oryzae]|uniref:Uncharacterized protein n=1 Tax=Xaviernesmea oryzae TaxID=464029 RepID=A0A1Q9B3P3_9HYPH|nr:hypothetical protein BJF93_07195 [Xaviernesmea oryzae]
MEALLKPAAKIDMGVDIERALGDVVVVFTDHDPASFQVAETDAPAFNVLDFQRHAINMRQSRDDDQKRQMHKPVARIVHSNDNAGRTALPASRLTAAVLSRP